MPVDLKLGYTWLIQSECQKQALTRHQTAYVLATAYWETNRTMEPVREAYWLSEEWRKKNLRYYPWYGRGFVQLTWKDNYLKAQEQLGVDLTTNPDAAMHPDISAQILVMGMKRGWFTSKKLADYIGPSGVDYVNARRIVNGTDRANDIARLAVEYEQALPKVAKPVTTPATNGGFWSNLFAAIFGRK